MKKRVKSLRLHPISYLLIEIFLYIVQRFLFSCHSVIKLSIYGGSLSTFIIAIIFLLIFNSFVLMNKFN